MAASTYLLSLILLFIVCPASFAATPDCDKANDSCNAKCEKLPIYLHAKPGYALNTDFIPQCKQACQKGFEGCRLQESNYSSCKTYRVRCISACPWSVVDHSNLDVHVTSSDSFEKCAQACYAGDMSCSLERKTTPKRNRTGNFDACQESQAGCYASCEPISPKDLFGIKHPDTNFPDLCAEACAKAVPSCKQAPNARAQCDDYYDACAQGCPTAITDSDGTTMTWSDSQKICQSACESARLYCEDILHLPLNPEEEEEAEKDGEGW